MNIGANEIVFGGLCCFVGGGLVAAFTASAAATNLYTSIGMAVSGAMGVVNADKIMTGRLNLEESAPG